MTYDGYPSKTAEAPLSFGIGDQVTVVRDYGRGPIEHDWKVADLVYSSEGELTHYKVTKPAEGGGVYKKRVPSSSLIEWNTKKHIPEAVPDIDKDGLIKSQLARVASNGSELSSPQLNNDVVIEITNLEREIRDALENKRLAQLAGDGEASVYWGQQAGQYTLELKALKNL